MVYMYIYAVQVKSQITDGTKTDSRPAAYAVNGYRKNFNRKLINSKNL